MKAGASMEVSAEAFLGALRYTNITLDLFKFQEEGLAVENSQSRQCLLSLILLHLVLTIPIGCLNFPLWAKFSPTVCRLFTMWLYCGTMHLVYCLKASADEFFHQDWRFPFLSYS